jgi:hypothetical protein
MTVLIETKERIVVGTRVAAQIPSKPNFCPNTGNILNIGLHAKTTAAVLNKGSIAGKNKKVINTAIG